MGAGCSRDGIDVASKYELAQLPMKQLDLAFPVRIGHCC